MFVSVNGLNMHVRIDGPADAHPLVLLHSLGTDLRVWEDQADALSRTYRIIRPDLRGHGLSEVPTGPYSIETMARDVLGLLDALGVSAFHLGGLSIGGMIAQSIATQAPSRVTALILCDTAMQIPPPESWRDRAALVRAQGIGVIQDAVIARWVTPGFIDTPPAKGLRTVLLRTAPEGYASSAEAIAASDLTESTKQLRLPALIIVGETDAATPVSSAEAMQQAIPGAKLVILPNAAHIPTVEKPVEVSQTILDFLANL